MGLRVGILTAAHGHVWSYVGGFRAHPDAELVGVWDEEIERGESFAQQTGLPFVGYLDDLLTNVDAVLVTSENNRHADHIAAGAKAGKHVLCEKPLVTNAKDAEQVRNAVENAGIRFMTAFPCRFSPAYQRLKERVHGGEIGKVRAICATNQGSCPFGWFVKKELSGGGAMIDHVVHVTDLLRDLLGEDPVKVQAQIGSNMYGQEWDDTAMLTLEFPSGVFASLDSSWSRPATYKTWGGVTMNVVGDAGTIELNMFGQAVDVYSKGNVTHSAAGYGSNFDTLMIDGFVRACLDGTEPPVTLNDGLQAAKVAIAGYASAASTQAVAVV